MEHFENNNNKKYPLNNFSILKKTLSSPFEAQTNKKERKKVQMALIPQARHRRIEAYSFFASEANPTDHKQNFFVVVEEAYIKGAR